MRSILALLVLIAVLLVTPFFAQSSELWRKDTLCGTMLSKPEETVLPGCQKAYCVNIVMDTRVCSCSKLPESHEAHIIIERNGTTTQQWDTEFIPPTSLADFLVANADLTGSGHRDIVVATMNGMSNGMGIQYWEVRAVVDGIVSRPMAVEDFGVMGLLTRSKSQNRCALLSTRWLWGQETKRGAGLYLMGMWFVYDKDSGEWLELDRPGIYRRYLHSFEKLRLERLNSDHPVPVLWFSSKEAKELVGPYPKFE